MNCAIAIKGSDKIKYFILDCYQDGRSFLSKRSNGVHNIKLELFDIKWTTDVDKTKKMSELVDVPFYDGVPVESRENVNAVLTTKIRAKYSINEEFKIHRLMVKSSKSKEDDAIIEEYLSTTFTILADGDDFKDRHFPKKEIK